MTLVQLLQSWREAPGFIILRHIRREELQHDPPVYLDRYYRFDGHTPPNIISGHNTDVLIIDFALPAEKALVVNWK